MIRMQRSGSADFSLFTAGNLLSITGRLMLAVAVEWEIYARTHSATALGLVGLVIVVPVVALSLPAGHLADRFSRKRIMLVSQIFSALVVGRPGARLVETPFHSFDSSIA